MCIIRKVATIARKYIDKASVDIVKENNDSLASLKKMGIKFIPVAKKDLPDTGAIRKDVINRLKGKVIAPNTLKLFEKANK